MFSVVTKPVYVRFQVLTAASMKFIFVFWDVLPCKIIVDRRFRGTCCLHHHGDPVACVQTGSGAHLVSCTMGTWGPFPGAKARPGRDAEHSPPYSAEVKNE
jgi:hypothetical protein